MRVDLNTVESVRSVDVLVVITDGRSVHVARLLLATALGDEVITLLLDVQVPFASRGMSHHRHSQRRSTLLVVELVNQEGALSFTRSLVIFVVDVGYGDGRVARHVGHD